MSTSPHTAMPARVAARTAAVVKKLTPEQLHAILVASTHRSGRVLTNLWETVQRADPALAEALDNLHATRAPEDLPRFTALQEVHAGNVAAAVRTRAGRLIAARVVGAAVLAAAALLAGVAGILSMGLAVSGVAAAAVLAVSGIRAGQRLAASLPTRMFSNPHTAASIVWDTAVDAAASLALRHREGEAGLTPDVLKALTSTWTGAGLSLDLLVPVVRTRKPKTETAEKKASPRKRTPRVSAAAETLPAAA